MRSLFDKIRSVKKLDFNYGIKWQQGENSKAAVHKRIHRIATAPGDPFRFTAICKLCLCK